MPKPDPNYIPEPHGGLHVYRCEVGNWHLGRKRNFK
jgi:hypothetical protein